MAEVPEILFKLFEIFSITPEFKGDQVFLFC